MTDQDGPEINRLGALEIHIQRRELRVDGAAARLGGRPFDILHALVEAAGAIVTKSDLMQRVWPNAAVGDNALQVHVFTIRQALGMQRTLLKTIPGRGYRLSGDWVVLQESDVADPPGPPSAAATPPSEASRSTSSATDRQRPGSDPQIIYRSGECEIDLARREVRIRSAAVPLGSRAFDILAILVEASGEVVARPDLLQQVWQGMTVGEAAIDVHMSAIRKALGPYRSDIKTVARRGYCLVGEWTRQSSAAPALAPSPQSIAGGTNLPEAVAGLFGRAEALEHLRQICSAFRIVTLTGPGGIGKTALAIALARSLLPDFDAGVWLVELASLADPNLLPLTVAEAVGIQSATGPTSAETVARGIGPKRLLLLLDNCEHLIGAAAQLAELIIRSTPNAVILATSRETLRTHGEYVYRVPPLDVPEHDTDQATHILANSAVQLFVDRAKALHVGGLQEAENLRPIAEICRHLDGIPLAIEFAAARAASLGLSQIAVGLGDRFALLTTGRRTALPRHRTLRAVFDWSYALLSEGERLLFQRLAIFSGGFTLDAACAVMQDGSWTEAADGIINLVEKSMIAVDRSSPGGRWRLLETVRAYALERLGANGDLLPTSRRHAEFFRGLFASFDPDVDTAGGGNELSGYSREVDNLRAALAWAFSASGDAPLGGRLAAAAVNFWLTTSLLEECRDWISKALAEWDGADDDEQEMVLRSGLGLALLFTEGMTAATHTNLTRALSIAEAIGNIEHQKRAVHAFWQMSLRSVELRKALQLSRRYAEFADSATDSATEHTASLMVGMSLTYLAEYGEASLLLERSIHDYPIAQRQRDTAWLGIDAPSSAFGHLSTCLFARGLIDAAIEAGERSIEAARQVGQAVVLCLALTRPAGVLLPEVGALDTADRYIREIMEQADRHALDTFRALAACANGRVLFMRGDPAAGAAALRSGLAQMEATGYRSLHTIFRGYFAEALFAAGDTNQGLAEAEAALRFAEQTEYMRFVPELLCIHGSLISLSQPDDPPAEQIFRRAIDMARGQQAPYWELRAAVSLAERWKRQGRPAEAHALVAPIYSQFTEGLATPVLTQAHALLRSTQGGD